MLNVLAGAAAGQIDPTTRMEKLVKKQYGQGVHSCYRYGKAPVARLMVNNSSVLPGKENE
jgi:hypothetical protein